MTGDFYWRNIVVFLIINYRRILDYRIYKAFPSHILDLYSYYILTAVPSITTSQHKMSRTGYYRCQVFWISRIAGMHAELPMK